MAKANSGWIGVDLDGTLAYYESKQFPDIGAPIPLMQERVKKWLAEGKNVKIMTARVVDATLVELAEIQDWLKEHIGQELDLTCQKDYNMIELWDDRAIQVIPNTGQTIADELASVRAAHEGKAAGS